MPGKNRLLQWLRGLYRRLFRLNDSPQRIAVGFGLGVFLGMLPGTGPIASLVMAAFLRVNKAAALLGSLLTNTWLSLVCLFLAVKIGAWMIGINNQELFNSWQEFLHHFHWKDILTRESLYLIMPVLAGYLVISLCLGILAFFLILTCLKFRRGEHPKH